MRWKRVEGVALIHLIPLLLCPYLRGVLSASVAAAV